MNSLNLNTDLKTGLASQEAKKRLTSFGKNVLEEKQTNNLIKFLSFFWGPIPWMIEAAVLLSGILQRWEDFTIICLMLGLNAGVGFWQQYKADNAITALKNKLALTARVLRDREWKNISASELVPGDIVLIKLGNIIPADMKLLSGEYLTVDQSTLTGESLPVEKIIGDEVYSGSIVRLGEMMGIVTGTGMNTYFGRTAKLVETAKTTSHFQKAVLKIGNFLIKLTLILVVIILIVAQLRHDPFLHTLLFALILTIAAIPVALPAVLTVTMAVGALNLARMKAIVSKLSSIEEMAGMDILCSDKTGTLTKNQLTMGEPVLIEAKSKEELILAAALASEQNVEDVIDQAILNALPPIINLKNFETLKFIPFDSKQKRTEATIKQDNISFQVAKGAPQVILELVQQPEFKKQVENAVDQLANEGYRALGIARRDNDDKWHYLGLIALFDPPRDDTLQTIQSAKNMGLEIKMLTGDHGSIAKEISHKIGLGENIVSAAELFNEGEPAISQLERVDGFAEVFPEHKFKIVTILQSDDHIVGMTGDGVNDAPALKQADIGIAVGGAVDAARAAADLVLTERGLSVITRAVEEARKIFERMNSYATFRIAETIRVLLFISASIVVFNFYPVTAVMIVLLAILNDFPIMMIAYDNVPVARYPVRWNMHRVLIISTALGITGVISTFILFYVAKDYFYLSFSVIQTFIFLKLLVAGHFTIYVTRNTGSIWQRPWPNWRLFCTIELTQILGTLAAVYGWFVTPIGWSYALLIWGYALVWMFIGSTVKLLLYKTVITRDHYQ
ncbi:magnesium-transporting ATPase, P-type [Legionella steelei]|uniref:Magnesium-transporting ATPase, P-type n=1 Tax=Legionella steelei TaxID=947033 RepID=A0A0W0ZCV7_9GAMM|nr:plasma-membrane proton-efflux P-type ATPase [Legionella steelei]KTD66903.1 magnesium-transporting ATPase, P-type [Legionella steelei]